MSRKLTQEEFLKKCRDVHGDTYDYSRMIYNGSTNKIEIGCRVHGYFKMEAGQHTNSRQGCSKCADIRNGERFKMSAEEFKKRAEAKYNNKFKYTLLEDFDYSKNIFIDCPTHGKFEIQAKQHLLTKYGCQKCANETRGICRRITLEDFISRSSIVHKYRYDYKLIDPSDIKGMNSKVDIVCPVHGKFKQTVVDHLHAKSGCPQCCQYGFRKNESGKIYIMTCGDITKVGITNGNADFRAKQISKSAGKKFNVFSYIHYEDGAIADSVETDILAILKQTHNKVEDNFDGYTECFLNVDNIELLKTIASLSQKYLKTNLKE